jgi:MoaA/NifB/PqqE/SkfB family radical SAM enzyme
MNIDNIKKIELEITSDCNAACPGCSRTRQPDLLKIQSFTLDDIKRIFPDKRHISNKQFKFCGVLGDPILNTDCLEMIRYLTAHNGNCQISTNGGYQTREWWAELGALSANTRLVDVVFAVDGHKETNHIYRVNTVFDVIERNMLAYSEGGNGKATATWMFIVFDHNEHELNIAQEHAARLRFSFATRTGIRNSVNDWVAKLPKKDKITKKTVKEEFIITTSEDKAHSKLSQVKELQQFINTYSNTTSEEAMIVVEPGKLVNDEETRNRIVNSIVCKFIHEGEIFIASDLTLWPCCFLWQAAFQNREGYSRLTRNFESSWNSLMVQDIDTILSHEWYDTILQASWNPQHTKHIEKCIRTCGNNKAYQNEIKIINDYTNTKI